jgi:riboflavin synthase
MFTGIVEALGRVEHQDHGRLAVSAGFVADLEVGASVAVNGCCVTVVEVRGGAFVADLSEETRARTTLAALVAGDAVNLERPLTPASPLGGHVVQGHVDGVGVVRHAAPELEVAVEPGLARYVVEKGSVAVDGVSLTVTIVEGSTFSVALIPHTAAVTTLGRRRPGDRVNVEVDVLAKYVERLVAPYRVQVGG